MTAGQATGSDLGVAWYTGIEIDERVNLWHVKVVSGGGSGSGSGQGLHMKEQDESVRTTSQLLQLILAEQRKTNQLLMMLIEALSEDADPDAEPLTYMDGSPRV